MYQNHTDEQLMLLYSDGNVEAFEALYTRHKGPVYRFFLRQINQSTAEELTQDVWSKLIQARQKYRSDSKFTTYIYTIARHCLIDHFRRQNVRPVASKETEAKDIENDIQAATQSEPDSCIANNEQQQALLNCIKQLPDDQRESFILKEESGLSLDIIGEITGSNKEAIKSRLRYALKKLKQCLNTLIEFTTNS